MRASSLILGLAAPLLAACEQKNPEPRFVDQAPAPAVAPPSAAPPPTAAAPQESGAAAAGLVWTMPEGWEIRPPSSQMRALEAVAPGAAGADPGELVILHFGPNGAGSVEDNLERWARQVSDEAGNAVVPTVETFEVGPLHAVMLESRGTYASGMPGGALTPKLGYAMLAAIVENGPSGPVYVRFTGPAETVDANREGFLSLLRALRPATP